MDRVYNTMMNHLALLVNLGTPPQRTVRSKPQRSVFSPSNLLLPPQAVPSVPADLKLETLSGTFRLKEAAGEPVIFNVYDNASGFSRALWQYNSSIDELILRAVDPSQTSPGSAPDWHAVFLSHAVDEATATGDVSALRELIRARFVASGVSGREQRRWERKLHFVKQPASTVSFVSGVTAAWQTTADHAHVQLNGLPPMVVPRLDARYDWLGWSYDPSDFGNASLPVAPMHGDGCSDLSANLSGSIALVYNSTACDYFALVRAAQSANASALVVVAPEGAPLVDMNCLGAECDDASVGLPATMVPWSVGHAITAALGRGETVRMGFSTAACRGTDFLVDAAGQLGQSWGGSGQGAASTDGNPGDPSVKLYPRFSFLAWAARFELYRARLARTVGSSDAPPNGHTRVVPLINSRAIRPLNGDCYGASPTGCGAQAVATVPRLTRHGGLQLDLALGCNGTRDVDCPQWDHVLQLRACKVPDGGWCDAQSGPEIGRWMTSFSRRVGRWLLDVTPLAPLIGSVKQSTQINVTIYSAPWAGNQGQIPWVVTLSLRLSRGSGVDEGVEREVAAATEAEVEAEVEAVEAAQPVEVARAEDEAHGYAVQRRRESVVLQPWANVTTENGGIASIFRWVAFNQSYDSLFAPFDFTLPRGTRRVRLFATITGHGNDNHGCGEFCGTEHRFVINSGAPHVKRSLLPATDAQLGCASEVDRGVTPNEYGTWLYGRDGWCNGSPVVPWVEDVTADAIAAAGNGANGKVRLTYTAVWCSSPTTCAPPNPGPPSTWSQAPPVMMPSVKVVID